MGFLVEETKITPFVSIEEGKITMKGRSIPEDSFEFYDPVLRACQDYVLNPPPNTEIIIHLDYVNSGSKKFLTNILTVFEGSYLQGNNYSIKWYYDVDDESIHDLGNDLKGIIKIPIQVILCDD
ncbi:MAG: hypothetical protein AMS27_08340 [Bacteroides sp. SM23_62_1]|nr:MAG: hypothetical protein AMS27_08340 [Bacteroides sp. SM23_62_1]